MNIKIFVVNIANPQEQERELNAFLSQHRVLRIEKEFVAEGVNSLWTFCVEYMHAPYKSDQSTPERQKEKLDYKAVLSEERFAIYSRLRELRKKLAEEAAVPTYAVFTNEQLAAMVEPELCGSLTQLEKIRGVGKAKSQKYGKAFLEVIAEAIENVHLEEAVCAGNGEDENMASRNGKEANR